jgi:hypothetical protein
VSPPSEPAGEAAADSLAGVRRQAAGRAQGAVPLGQLGAVPRGEDVQVIQVDVPVGQG